ncbi:MAG: CdaR family protein [Candidatus Latescibacterota bacterium]
MNIFKSGTNTAAKMFSVLAALILWFHVTAGATFTTLISVPVRYILPVRGLMVASETPDRVLVLVRGTGRSLLSYNLRKFTDQSRQYVLINLAGLSAGKHRVIVERDQILLGTDGIEVESIIENGEFDVTLDLKISSTVTVDVDSIPGLEVAKDAVVVGKPVVVPRYVTIEGPENILASLTEVPIESLLQNRVSLSDTVLKARLNEDFREYVTVEPKQVTLRFSVERLLEKTIGGIPVRLQNFPWRRRFVTEPDSVTVTIRGPESLVAKVEARNIAVGVPYQSFMQRLESGQDSVQPTVDLPDGVTGSVSPDMIRVVPRQQQK